MHPTLAAAHADVMDVNWLPAATGLVVFLVAFGILWVKVWPRILRGLDERNEKILTAISEAEDSREQAKQALAAYESSLAEAREEANRMIAEAKTNAGKLAEELRSKSEQELTEMKQRAGREIEAARQSAVASLHAEAATLATTIAGKILQREVSATDQERLIADSLDELGQFSRT